MQKNNKPGVEIKAFEFVLEEHKDDHMSLENLETSQDDKSPQLADG